LARVVWVVRQLQFLVVLLVVQAVKYPQAVHFMLLLEQQAMQGQGLMRHEEDTGQVVAVVAAALLQQRQREQQEQAVKAVLFLTLTVLILVVAVMVA
jgi:hypothetical protein